MDFIETTNRATRPNEPGVLELADLDGFFVEIMQQYMTNYSEAFARVLSLRALLPDTVTSLAMRFEDDAKTTEDNHMTTWQENVLRLYAALLVVAKIEMDGDYQPERMRRFNAVPRLDI